MKNTKIFLIIFFTVLINLDAISQITATYNEVISKQKKGRIDTYITQSGEVFRVGDTITLGVAFRNEQFNFVKQNATVEYYPVLNSASNSIVRIKKIVIRSKKVLVYTTKPPGFIYGLTIINFESAISTGEVKSKILSSDQALEELKKWKEKLDLELITKEMYEQKKQELSKYIK